MEFRIINSGAPFRNLLDKPRKTAPLIQMPGNLLTSNQCKESEFFNLLPFWPHLEPPQSLRYEQKDCLFSTPYMDIHQIDILPIWTYLLNEPLPLIVPHENTLWTYWTCHLPFIIGQLIALSKLVDSDFKRRHEPRKAGWQGAGKFYKLYYKRTPEILRLYNILWRWSSGSEAQ